MKISIITATFNSASTLRDTFDSILAQTYKNYELIVQDGHSKDKTLDIIREYEPRFEGKMKWVSESDKGIYDAMNKGIARASGDIVGVLNSDDLYYDEKVLDEINNAFERYHSDCVFANLIYVHQDDVTKVSRTWISSPYKKGKFQRGWAPAHPTFYIKRSCIEKYGAFNIDYQVSADFEFMLRMLESHHILPIFIDRFFVRMRVGGESNGTLQNIIKGNRNILRAFKENNIPVSRLYPFYRLLPKIFNLVNNKIARKRIK